MFDYTIARDTSNEEFKNTCNLIETSTIKLNKSEILIDVDGSLLQMYRVPDGLIKVYNDYTVGAVYVESDVELPFLHNWWDEVSHN